MRHAVIFALPAVVALALWPLLPTGPAYAVLAAAAAVCGYLLGRRRTYLPTVACTTLSADFPDPEADRLRLSAAIVHHLREAVIIMDPDLVVREGNPAAAALMRVDAGDLAGRPLAESLRDGTATEALASMRTAVANEGRWTGSLVLAPPGRDPLPTEASLVAIRDAAGAVRRLILVCRDVSERSAAEARVEYLANYDRLTNLPNAGLFRDRLEQATVRAGWSRQRLAVLLLDLDNFGLINQGFDRERGDRVLCAVAERLRGALHRGDSLARTGGDKFALLQVDIGRADQAAFRARHLLDLLEPPVTSDGRELNISASIGIAVYPEDGDGADILTHNADHALQRAKAEGRGSYRFFLPGMEEETRLRCTLEHDIGRGLQREEFLFHYQPQVELATGRVIGSEALLRWQHPEYGLLYPDQFIPMAEESGAILEIGDWGLREACRQHAAWLRGGHRVGRLAVNLSAVQFRQADLGDMVRDALRESGADPRRLELEITESAALDNPELAASIMHPLEELGVEFAIDDFGTGYSSLNYLRQLPIRALKVDRSLIGDLADDSGDAAIIRSVVDLGHNLGLRVLAEGIERDDQLRFLRACRCDLGQGLSFSGALPPEAFLAFLRRRGARRRVH